MKFLCKLSKCLIWEWIYLFSFIHLFFLLFVALKILIVYPYKKQKHQHTAHSIRNITFRDLFVFVMKIRAEANLQREKKSGIINMYLLMGIYIRKCCSSVHLVQMHFIAIDSDWKSLTHAGFVCCCFLYFFFGYISIQ